MFHLFHLSWLGIAASLPVEQWSTAFSLMFAGLLCYLGFRERYLLLWLAGWVSFLLSLQAVNATMSSTGNLANTTFSHCAFLLAVTLFAWSALYYTDSRVFTKWVGALCLPGLGAVVAQSIWFPGSIALSLCFQVSYHAIAALAAVRLILFAMGRFEIGPWAFAATLLLLHSDVHAGSPAMVSAYLFSSEALLRISILLVVLDESRARSRRLDVMNAITTVAIGARDYSGMMLTAMNELCRIYGARNAWFQMVEGDHMVMKQNVGLPDWFIAPRLRVPLRSSAIKVLLKGSEAAVVSVRSMDAETRRDFERAGMHYLLLVPVAGKAELLGNLTFGLAGRRSFTSEQLRFLTTTGNQLGIAGENLNMIEQVLHTQAELKRHNRELAALNAMANIATQTFDLDAILQNTLHWADELFGQHCDILLFDPESGRVSRTETNRENREIEREILHRLAEEDLAEYIQRARSEVITETDLLRLPMPAQLWITSHSLRSFIGVVMYSQRKTIGILLISSTKCGQFTETDRNFAIAIARQLGNSVEKIMLYEDTALAYDDLRKAQQQLLQSEKMSAVGQLVSGVAHELNNPLTAILGYAQLLESEPIGEQARDYVRKLFRQTQRTHRVIQNLLSFSRQRKPMQSQVDLRRILEDTLALREYDLKLNNVSVERDYDPEVPFITGDAHQLEQVFLNIINNAVDAIMDSADGGSLVIRIYAEDDRVCVEFRDSGPGLQQPSKIFDPFYTTKKIGKGTGLGLSICYGIVKEHGGDIMAFNHEQGGASFLLKLPVAGPRKALITELTTPIQ